MTTRAGTEGEAQLIYTRWRETTRYRWNTLDWATYHTFGKLDRKTSKQNNVTSRRAETWTKTGT